MANVFQPQFDRDQQRDGFTYRRSQVGRQAGGERLGASVYEIPPGQATFPYHHHTANEEMLIVLSGTPALRTPQGWRELEQGEVVSFPAGEAGAHQIANRTSDPVRVLMISEMNAPELNVYPDSGKVGAMTRPPGGRGDGDRWEFLVADRVDYWEGEEPPEPAP
jgi:uncharacterized cupin superfamily protein